MAIAPFITSKNYCMYCGTKDSIIYKDLHGKDYNQLLYPIQYAICTKCNHIYFIKWVKDDNSNDMIPFYGDEKQIDDFSKTIIEYSKTHRRILS